MRSWQLCMSLVLIKERILNNFVILEGKIEMFSKKHVLFRCLNHGVVYSDQATLAPALLDSDSIVVRGRSTGDRIGVSNPFNIRKPE